MQVIVCGLVAVGAVWLLSLGPQYVIIADEFDKTMRRLTSPALCHFHGSVNNMGCWLQWQQTGIYCVGVRIDRKLIRYSAGSAGAIVCGVMLNRLRHSWTSEARIFAHVPELPATGVP